MFSCILFDVDGTLLNTKKTTRLAAQAAIRETLGKEVDGQIVDSLFGISNYEAAPVYGYSDPMDFVVAIEKHYAVYAAQYNELFPGVPGVLNELKTRGVPMGVITARTRQEYDFDFDIFGLHQYFGVSVTLDDTVRGKPAADPIEKYIAQTGAQRSAILFVGDTPPDYGCAQNAGVAFAFAGWSGNNKIAGADYCLNTPDEILALVE
ncbi:MAG TPA: hypothetical protein DEB31_05110 [Clostridiales bacterium]|nr:hypothetical protein [Clostridiales bacterium]